jgi:hypothetical protein
MKLLAQALAVEIVLAIALLPVAAQAEARAPAKVRYQTLDRMLKQLAREAEAKRLVASR